MIRTPPNDVTAEQNVLGALMLVPEAIDRIGKLEPADFYRRDHQVIFAAVLALHAKGIPADAVTLADAMPAGLVEWGYVVGLAKDTASAAHAHAYAEIVRRKAELRRMIDRGSNIVEAAFEPDADPVSIADSVVADLMQTTAPETSYDVPFRKAMSMAYAQMQNARRLGGKIPGITSGLRDLDRVLGGWQDGDLIIVGARAKMGKTSLLLNFANACDVPAGLISGEQPASQIGARLMSLESGVSATKLRTGQADDDDLLRLRGAVERMVDRPLYIHDKSAPRIADVVRVFRRWKREHGIRIGFVDYVQRIQGTDLSLPRHERVGEVVMTLKSLARDLNIPIVALAQVSRQVEQRTDKRPHMGDLSDSSEIEKEADEIVMLYRDEVYNDDSEHKGTAELLIEANRHGPVGFVRCAWFAPTMRFADLGHAA